jgi:hypothetical protein
MSYIVILISFTAISPSIGYGLCQVFKQFSVFSNVGLIKFKHIKMNVYDSKSILQHVRCVEVCAFWGWTEMVGYTCCLIV